MAGGTLGGVREVVRRNGSERRLETGETICSIGEMSDRAFLVVDGEVEAALRDGLVVATHGPGALVGEITALVGGRRTATLRATGPATVIEIDRSGMRAAMAEAGPAAEAELMAAARDRTDRSRVASLLADQLGPDHHDLATDIAKTVSWRSLAAGERLFALGDAAGSAYLVVSGRLEVGEATDTDSAPILTIGRGEIVGELGLLDRAPRSATVHAARSSLLAELARDDFVRLLASHPELPALLVRRTVARNSASFERPARARAIAMADLVGDGALMARLTEPLDAIAETTTLGPSEIDGLLGQPGIAESRPGDLSEARLIELLHEAEQSNDHLVLDVSDGAAPIWSRRAVQRADLLVALVDADPSPEQVAEVQRLRASASRPLALWVGVVHGEDALKPDDSESLRRRLDADRLIHLRGTGDAELGRLARLAAGRGIGLALSGGGGRGLGHLGVLEALEELGVPVDAVVGTSMGSVIAAVHAQGLTGNERRQAVADQVKKLLDYTLPLVSMISGRRISASIESQFGEWEIGDTWVPYACVSTSLTHSERRTHRRGPLGAAIRASVAIPGVLPPVPADGELLVDGGVLDNLPIGLLTEDEGIGTIIASDVAPTRGPIARDDYGTSVSGWKALRRRVSKGRSPYPGIVGTLLRSTLVSSTRDRDRHVESGAIDCYLRLDLRGVGLLEFEIVDEVADRALELARPEIAAWSERAI